MNSESDFCLRQQYNTYPWAPIWGRGAGGRGGKGRGERKGGEREEEGEERKGGREEEGGGSGGEDLRKWTHCSLAKGQKCYKRIVVFPRPVELVADTHNKSE